MNLIIGSSHSLQLAQAAGRFEATWEQASADLLPVETTSGADTALLFVTPRPGFMELSRDPGGRISASFGPLAQKIRAFDRSDATVLFAIGGNEHNIRFLCADPRPFDFSHPSAPQLDPSRQILPLVEVRAVVARLVEQTLLVTRLIAELVPKARRCVLAPPPPIASEAQIRTNPAVFDLDKTGIEDAVVRLKIYNVYLEVLARFCAQNGFSLVAPGPGTRDEAGFLKEAYWEGSTHAKPDYYRNVVAEFGL